MRIFSLVASSIILSIAIVADGLSWLYWYQLKDERRSPQSPQSRSWKFVLYQAIMTFTSLVLSVSLLIFSLSTNEKICEMLLLLFGRFLILRQV